MTAFRSVSNGGNCYDWGQGNIGGWIHEYSASIRNKCGLVVVHESTELI